MIKIITKIRILGRLVILVLQLDFDATQKFLIVHDEIGLNIDDHTPLLVYK